VNALLYAIFAVACGTGPAPVPPVKAPVIEEIDETTVGDLDGVRVPMGNVTHGEYTLPDGTTKTGDICSLVIPGRERGGGVFVGAGSVVEVDGTKWKVLAVDNPTEGLGSVRLQKLD